MMGGGAIHMAKGSDKEDFEVTLKRLGLGSTKPLPGLSLDTKLPLPSTPSVLRVGSELKPNYYSYQDRADAAGSTLYPFPEEMEAAKRPATVNPLMQRQALRRSPETPQNPIEPEEQTYTDSDRSFTPSPSPTFRQNRAADIQRLLNEAGSPKPRARSLAESFMGVGGSGIADFVPYLGTGMAWQEGIRNIQEANRTGDTAGALGEAALMSAMTAIGIGPALKLANHLAGKIKSPLVRMSKADYERMAREGAPKQLSAPESQRLLNGPKEQRLLNAPAREKTVFEMQHELAQKRAALPVKQGGLGLPADNTPAQRAAAMGFDTTAYHGTHSDVPVFDRRKNVTAKDIYSSPNPVESSAYAENLGGLDGNVMPLLLRGGVKDLTQESPYVANQLRKAYNAQVRSSERKYYPFEQFQDSFMRGQLYQDSGGQSAQNALVDELIGNKNPILKIPDAVSGGGVGESYVVANPDNIRSRFAAFDPFRRNAAIAAATGSVAPDLLAEEYANGGEVTSDDLILIERRS